MKILNDLKNNIWVPLKVTSKLLWGLLKTGAEIFTATKFPILDWFVDKIMDIFNLVKFVDGNNAANAYKKRLGKGGLSLLNDIAGSAACTKDNQYPSKSRTFIKTGLGITMAVVPYLIYRKYKRLNKSTIANNYNPESSSHQNVNVFVHDPSKHDPSKKDRYRRLEEI